MTVADRGNPLYELHAESHRTTINGVPAFRLHGHLPPPIECRECAFPTWFLIDPDAVDGADEAKRGELVMVAEWSAACVNPAKQKELGVLAQAPMCGHPYHLVNHVCEPGKQRLLPVLPDGLVVRA